ncbi:MAG: YkgJ family cysteine cluster protein [Thermodesulfobacteriota bacterium]
MDFDLTPYFKKYEALAKQADQIFDRVKNEYPACVNCKKGCTDCCYALFDLTLVEALYINHHFKKTFGADAELMEKANKADRAIFRLKKRAYRDVKENNKDEVAVLYELGRERIRCPFLNERELCALYEHRPITCRLYGIPTAIQGMGHTCGKSGFNEGEKYPMVNMDRIFDQLKAISSEIVADIKTPHTRLDELLVPLSMAILTDYDDVFFGFAEEKEKEEEKGQS